MIQFHVLRVHLLNFLHSYNYKYLYAIHVRNRTFKNMQSLRLKYIQVIKNDFEGMIKVAICSDLPDLILLEDFSRMHCIKKLKT